MQIVSFNLEIFTAPPDTAYDRAPFKPEEWAAKTAFVTEMLASLKPDVVVFQEVFSVEALRALCAEQGLPHFTTAGVAPVQGEVPGNFVNPVNAIASKLPFVDEFRVPFAAEVAMRLDLPQLYDFSRPPVGVVVQDAKLGAVTVVGVHLKSKRADVQPPLDAYPADMPWQERVRDTMSRNSTGLVRSMLRRGAEATALYHHLAGLLTADPKRAVVVMGDVNDSVTSITMDALTMRGGVGKIGTDEKEDWPEGTDRRIFALQLADAAILTAKPEGAPRKATHYFRGVPGILDYALVSNALNPRNRQSRGWPETLRVVDAHIADPVRPHSTDHALLALRLEARPAAAPAD